MSSFTTSEPVLLDMTQLSGFVSEPDIISQDPVMYIQQPTTFIGKLFRIICTTFSTTGNVAIYNDAKNTV
jgi:hypothetical protein